MAVVKSSKNLKKKKLWILSKKIVLKKSNSNVKEFYPCDYEPLYSPVEKKQLSWRYRNRKRIIKRSTAPFVLTSLSK